jgi:photosystem II stability/assembly factor-like uncharacterized protein
MRRSCVLLVAALAAALLLAAAAASPAAALVPNGTHGWFWQMPQPAGGAGMEDVSFGTDADVWTVGDDGLVQHSADGGQTWALQPTGTDEDLWYVDFADGQHGVAGGLSVVLTTADGGTTWAVKTPATLPDEGCTGVHMADEQHIWVSTYTGAVVRTADGGVTWQRTAVDPLGGGVLCDFVDSTHGWAIADGARVWRTTDGGASWRLQTTGAGARSAESGWQIRFFDRRHGWVLDSSADYTAAVYSTADGGAHWSRVSGADPGVARITPVSPESAWFIVGAPSGENEVVLQHTTDLGRHVSTRAMGSPVRPWALATHGERLCAVGDGILLSSDAGATWRAASSGQSYVIADIDPVSATDIWAVDRSGALLHSTDGVRWAEQDFPARYSAALYGVSFPDENNGWVVGSADQYGSNGGVILHTADGGATWTPQSSSLAGGLGGVQFVDDLDGWAISDQVDPFTVNGAVTCIERTLDGGQTWIPLFVASGAGLYDLQFVDDHTGWAAGYYQPVQGLQVAAVFKTTNGGFTWMRQTLPKGAPPITGVRFTDADTGWALGIEYDWDTGDETGWMFHTTDGGKTWTRVPDKDDMLGSVVTFSDALHGWIGGDNGVWATSDGGASWQWVATMYGVAGLAALDQQHVWAGGYGSLVSTVDGTGDSAAPATLLDGLSGSLFTRSPLTLGLSANDIGGSGLAGLEYKVDGDAWQSGDSVLLNAPADHSYDGVHSIFYRATDNAGNREGTERAQVCVDTLGPACGARRPSTVNSGKTGILTFTAADATSGVAKVTLTIRDDRGRAVKRIVERQRTWFAFETIPYYWLRFHCGLKPGRYTVEVRGTDWAGNPQAVMGRSRLRVVRRGAPAQVRPAWPEGLAMFSFGFGPRQGAEALPGHRFLVHGVVMTPPALRRAVRQR